jgi:hypothetical protein
LAKAADPGSAAFLHLVNQTKFKARPNIDLARSYFGRQPPSGGGFRSVDDDRGALRNTDPTAGHMRAGAIHFVTHEAADAGRNGGVLGMSLAVEKSRKADDPGKESGGGEGHIRNIEFTSHVNLQVIGRK